MKKIIYIVILLVIVFFGYKYFSGSRSTAKPDVVVVEKMLGDYLIKRTESKCNGTVNLEFLRDVSVGEYKPNYLGGNEDVWPVYANYELTCREGGKTRTFEDLNDGKSKVAITFLHKNAFGRFELFEPKIISKLLNR